MEWRLQLQTKLTDRIREYPREHYIQPARRQGAVTVRIVAGDVHRKLGLSGRAPAVCQALGSNIFLKNNNLKLIDRQGPPSGQSTTMEFTYQLLSDANNMPAKSLVSHFEKVHGIAKDLFEKLGGGEAFIREERAHFYADSDPAQDRGSK